MGFTPDFAIQYIEMLVPYNKPKTENWFMTYGVFHIENVNHTEWIYAMLHKRGLHKQRAVLLKNAIERIDILAGVLKNALLRMNISAGGALSASVFHVFPYSWFWTEYEI